MTATLDDARWQMATRLAERWIAEDTVTAISFATGTAMHGVPAVHRGSLTVDGQTPLPDRPIYLVASITKPIVALGALLLVERGLLTLGDRVTEYIPEFGRQGKSGIEIRHLLTHTSGLPDMLPNNAELRKAHAPLSEFLRYTCEGGVIFPPGRGVQYQSMGFVVLAEIITRITGVSCAEFLHRELFEPLGMSDTRLGLPNTWFEEMPAVTDLRIPQLRIDASMAGTDNWNWNSRYWRQLGAPWGGLFTSVDDLARFARMLLKLGALDDGTPLLSPATIRAATRNQLQAMREVPEDERRCRPWGLGFRLNWPAHSANFGDLLSTETYGHWGATGTVLWVDPTRGVYGIVLSNQPQEPGGLFLARLSNAIIASWR